MTWPLLAVIVLEFAFMLRQSALMDRERDRHAKELQRFADRIQHPEVRQVDPGPVVDVEPPKDAAEMAWVGEVVPEFVHVGEQKG